MAQDSQEIRQKINNMHERLGELSYYEVMDLTQDLDQAIIDREVGGKFRELAREWHVDRFSPYGLSDEEREKVQEIFSFINTAQQVLTNPNKRAEYDMQLAGDNTDIGSILNAEAAFRRGQNMLESGSYKGAHEQFRIACENNADDDEYKAHYLYTEYLLVEKNTDGKPLDKKRSQEIYQELDDLLAKMPERDWLLAFLGVVAMGVNKLREAEALFSEALHHNPRNIIAQRQQRLLKMRKGNKKGFFAQIKEKLGMK